MNSLLKTIFFGNIFYGIIAVAMCIETNVIHGLRINHFPFYIGIFLASWIYYTMIYLRSIHPVSTHLRTAWYRLNVSKLKSILFVAIIIEILLLLLFIYWYREGFAHVSFFQWIMVIAIPLAAALYTFNLPLPYVKKIRQVGWLKPFVVGFTWSSWVTFYPLLAWQIQHPETHGESLMPNLFFWLSNFLFITILAIIFDVKDFKSDTRHKLKTFPAQYGIGNTYKYIIIPATIINIFILIFFQQKQHFSLAQCAIQMLPFILLSLDLMLPKKQRSILYYLVFIDGLMLIKALTGILSIQYF